MITYPITRGIPCYAIEHHLITTSLHLISYSTSAHNLFTSWPEHDPLLGGYSKRVLRCVHIWEWFGEVPTSDTHFITTRWRVYICRRVSPRDIFPYHVMACWVYLGEWRGEIKGSTYGTLSIHPSLGLQSSRHCCWQEYSSTSCYTSHCTWLIGDMC